MRRSCTTQENTFLLKKRSVSDIIISIYRLKVSNSGFKIQKYFTHDGTKMLTYTPVDLICVHIFLFEAVM